MAIQTELSATLNVPRGPATGANSVLPHGGTLVDRLVTSETAPERARAGLERARSLPKIALDARTSADAELIATGVLSPLEGFMGREDYRGVVREMRLAKGKAFSIPITLGADKSRRDEIKEGTEVALTDTKGEPVGVIDVDSVFDFDRDEEAREVYRTTDEKHPGVAWLNAHREEFGVGGKVTLFSRTINRAFPAHHRDPQELRALLLDRGWKKTVAFQTRNPIHRAHEYLLRCALETVDGLVIHPLVGETKGDDVPAKTRVAAYEALLEYFPKDRVALSVFPFAMRYAGPREAVLHAIARQNYGFSHFIVGRDHAGVGNYYGTYDAQKIFSDLRENDLEITPIFFEHSFYCEACGGVSSLKTCPHDPAKRLVLSGTRVRELLSAGERLPESFTRPAVAEILRAAYAAQRA